MEGSVRFCYRVFPSFTSAMPYSSPNESSIERNASKARPSILVFSRRAWRTKFRSLSEISASRGIGNWPSRFKSLRKGP